MNSKYLRISENKEQQRTEKHKTTTEEETKNLNSKENRNLGKAVLPLARPSHWLSWKHADEFS